MLLKLSRAVIGNWQFNGSFAVCLMLIVFKNISRDLSNVANPECFILVYKLPWQCCTCHCASWGEKLAEVCTFWGEKPVHQQCKTDLWTCSGVFWWWAHWRRTVDCICKVWRGSARGQNHAFGYFLLVEIFCLFLFTVSYYKSLFTDKR